jgi:hypothetical protein
MPKFRFLCTKCNTEITRYVPSETEKLPCSVCDSDMERQMPISGKSQVRELVDPYSNRRWDKDHQETIKKRKEDHYWEVEVPRLIQTHSVQTSLEKGWLKYNDKGELVINKPPSKR